MKNTAIIISALFFAFIFLTLAKIQHTANAQQTTQTQKQDESYIYKKKTASGFVYKSDTRPFAQRPQNPAAIEQKWTNKVDQMVLVKPKSSNMRPFYIDAFEATVSNHRAWSVPNQIPTDRLRYDEADTACAAAGKRLCYTHEWQAACRGGSTKPVSFNQAAQMLKICDFARSNTYDENDYLVKTDSHPKCTAPGLPIYHMIGNVAEFTRDAGGKSMVVGLTYYDGKMPNKGHALKRACERIVAGPGQYPAQQYNKGTGFRCCKDTR